MSQDFAGDVEFEEGDYHPTELLAGFINIAEGEQPCGSWVISDFMQALDRDKQIWDEESFKIHRLVQTPKVNKDWSFTPYFERTQRKVSGIGAYKYNFDD